MDPLWEFILDDHEDTIVAEEPAGRRNGRSLRGARKTVEREKKGKEIGFFDSLFGCENDYSDETMHDNRDDSNNARVNDKRDSKRRNHLTEDSGVDNSMWHLFGGGQKESKKSPTIASKPSKRSASRTTSSKATKTPAAQHKRAKKGWLLWRLRRKDRDNETIGTGHTEVRPNTNSVTSVSHPVTTDRTDNEPQHLSTNTHVKSIMKNTEQKETETQTNDKDEILDPFRFFVEMVEAFDPFASDDSESDSVVTEIASETVGHETGARAMVDIDRLVEQARNDSKVTEIRLNFRPESEERYYDEEEYSQTQDMTREQVGDPYHLDDNSITASVSSGPTRMTESHDMGCVVENDDCAVQEDQLDDSSMSLLTPISREPTKYRSLQLHDQENEHEQRPLGLKRLASCCTSKNVDIEFVTHLQSVQSPPAATVVMPAARLAPDDEKAGPMSFDASPVEQRNVEDASATEITETKGLQSVYAYDYGSQENLDVFYSAMGGDPRSSMVVRQLGGVPSISASAPNEVIVRVEVREEYAL
jgi:hypothetical protein